MSDPRDPHPIFYWYEADTIYGVQIATHDQRRVVYSEGGSPPLTELRDIAIEDMEDFDTDGRYLLYAMDGNHKRKPMPYRLRVARADGNVYGADVANVGILTDETIPIGRDAGGETSRAAMRLVQSQVDELQARAAELDAREEALLAERRQAEQEQTNQVLMFMQLQIEESRTRADIDRKKAEAEIERLRSQTQREEEAHRRRLDAEERAHKERMKREEDERKAREAEDRRRRDELDKIKEENRQKELELQGRAQKAEAEISQLKLEKRWEEKLTKLQAEQPELSQDVRDKLALMEFELRKEESEQGGDDGPFDKVVNLIGEAVQLLRDNPRQNSPDPGQRSEAPVRSDHSDDPFDDPGHTPRTPRAPEHDVDHTTTVHHPNRRVRHDRDGHNGSGADGGPGAGGGTPAGENHGGLGDL